MLLEALRAGKTPRSPGQHGAGRKKTTAYSAQLREKQKAKRAYGLTETQFKSYYVKAEKSKAVTGEMMLIMLERRLDNVVFRMCIGSSRAQSRQLVTHGHFTVNGKPVNIPSYLVKAGDVIAVKDTKKIKPFFTDLKSAKVSNLPKWLSFDPASLKGEVLALPAREDVDLSVSEQMIVELYSK